MHADDTIFALSSGAPPAAIAIVRISGPQAVAAVTALAGKAPPERKASLRSLRDPQTSELLDQALVLRFDGPGTATGEDLMELHLHGGRAVVRAVERCLARIDGLRPAEAGEFTRRAFFNGRINLNEADALGDLLAADNERQRRAAATMLSGRFGEAIDQWQEEVLRLSALVEAELDFSDEDDVEDSKKHVITDACGNLVAEIGAILSQPSAEKLHTGLSVVLGGPPNSGKSTLLNALADREAAIVSDIAGTTRDVIEAPISLDGIPIILSDTAGLRADSQDEIEAIGIARANAAFERADIVLWLGEEGRGPSHPTLIEISAKQDNAAHRVAKETGIAISAKTGHGMPALTQKLIRTAKDLIPPEDGFAVNARQRAALSEMEAALAEASTSNDLLIIGELLRRSRLALDALTGRGHTEDMLDALFGRFCIGK